MKPQSIFHKKSPKIFDFLFLLLLLFLFSANFAHADERDGTGNSRDFSKNFSIFSNEEDRKLQEQQFLRLEIKKPDLPKFPNFENNFENLENSELFKDFTQNVSGATQNKFYLYLADDALRLDKDGVVRYVLFIQTKNGGKNLSFEGIRCQTQEWILYATGNFSAEPPRWNDDKLKNPKTLFWKPIQNVPVNRYHAALAENYFCPDKVSSVSLEEIKIRIQRN